MYHFKIIEQEQISSIIPFLKTLDKTLDDSTLQQRLNDMKSNNYECVGAYYNNELIGICGLWILNKYYIGRHIEPDNVIIKEKHRGSGVGEQMMNWIEEYGISKGCVASELNCYVSNHKGVRFWIKQGYKIIGYHMQKKL